MTCSTSTYFAIWAAWSVVALAVVPYLLLRPAPYGRHGRPGWGPVLDARLAWLLMEVPSPLGMTAFFLFGRATTDHVATVFLAMWLGHYGYRALLYPLLMPPAARPMPVVVLASGASFNLVNAYLNGCWLFVLADPRPIEWLTTPRFVFGALLFVAGFALHFLTDRKLRRQRATSDGRYVAPAGRLFHWVSCPNYLGEIIEWTGFALATWSPGGLLFAIWTAANLIPRAVHHHRWYRESFPDYPRARRAVIPYVL